MQCVEAFFNEENFREKMSHEVSAKILARIFSEKIGFFRENYHRNASTSNTRLLRRSACLRVQKNG